MDGQVGRVMVARMDGLTDTCTIVHVCGQKEWMSSLMDLGWENITAERIDQC